MAGAWGATDPNSAHQLWSHWIFRVRSDKNIPLADVEKNVGVWLRKGFGSVGQARVAHELVGDPVVVLYRIEAQIEGPPAHDPDYVASVKAAFRRFVDQGWGVTALSSVSVKIIAGDEQGGLAAKQLIVIPSISLKDDA